MAIYPYALHTPLPIACRGGVLTIGNFDGVHVGHQALLREATRQARLLAVPSVAVTFDPHPSHLLRPDQLQPLLTTLDQRTALLQAYGIDHVLVVQTTPSLLQLSARTFFEQIIVACFQARALVEGFNFGFGHGREGTIEVLKGFCGECELPLTLMSPQEVLGKPVSSSRVRAELLAGEVAVVSQLLGRPYRIHGSVGTGERRGATLGFPTANLQQIATLLPGNGVYAARAWQEQKSWPAAVNVGPNPTFGEQARKVEAHLLDFQGDLYGQGMEIEFVAKIRDTQPFRSGQELIEQIQKDVAAVKKIV